jgi:hypothetical protein
MDNFNLKKYLIENKLTPNSNLNELAKHGSWTPEKLEQEASKYKKAGDFFKGNQYAYIEYRKAVKNGIIQNKFKQEKPTPILSSPTMDVSNTPNFNKPAPQPKLMGRPKKLTPLPTTMTVSNTPKFGKPTTTSDKLKSDLPKEPYTYDEPSLLDFVKKHIGNIENDVTGHYHDTYPAQYSSNAVSEYKGIVFIGGNKYVSNIAILDHAPTQKDLEITGTNKDDWRLEYDKVMPKGVKLSGNFKMSDAIKKNYYWHARVK